MAVLAPGAHENEEVNALQMGIGERRSVHLVGFVCRTEPIAKWGSFHACPVHLAQEDGVAFVGNDLEVKLGESHERQYDENGC